MMLNVAVLACLLVISSAAQSPFGTPSNPQSGQPTGNGTSSNNNSGNPAPPSAPPASHNSTEQHGKGPEAEMSPSAPNSTVVPILFAGNSTNQHGNLSVTTPAAPGKHTGHDHASHATTIAVGSSLFLVLIAPMF